MIYLKQWARKNKGPGTPDFLYTGWFLLGFIPLYIRRDGYSEVV